jgi:hypothetical protein
MISDTTIAATQSLGCDLKINSKSIFYCISRSSDYRNLFFSVLNSDIVTVDPKLVLMDSYYTLYISNCFSIIWSKCVFYFNIGTVLAGIIGYIGGSLVLWSLSKTYEVLLV